jgi:hypothetical protein
VVDDDRLTGVELADRRVVAQTALFVRPDNCPHDDRLLAGLGCELKAGLPLLDGTGGRACPASGRPATWPTQAQVITSTGAGSAAAIAINADPVQEDIDRAVAHLVRTHRTRDPKRVVLSQQGHASEAPVADDSLRPLRV